MKLAHRSGRNLLTSLVAVAAYSQTCHAWSFSTAYTDYRFIAQYGGGGNFEAFPDLIRLSDGRLMASFYEGYTHLSDGTTSYPKGGKLMYATSSDGGVNWSSAKNLYDSIADDRDPSIAQLPDGKLVVNFFKRYPNAIYPSGEVLTVTSPDAGKTWSAEQFVSSIYATSSGVERLINGRLVMPMYRSVALSDDNALNWRKVETTATTAYTETDVLQRLKTGTTTFGELYAVHRDDGGGAMRTQVSKNNGETWGAVGTVGFSDVGFSPSLFRASNGVWLLGYGAGTGTYLRTSLNEGATWGGSTLIDNKLGAYPSFAQTPDGTINVAYYEEDGASTKDVRIQRFTVDTAGTLTQKTYTNSVTDGGNSVIYSETFPNAGGAAIEVGDIGWKYTRFDGTRLHTEATTAGLLTVSNNGGSGGGGGYVFMGGAGASVQTLLYTSEVFVEVDSSPFYHNLKLAFETYDDTGNESFRAALRVGTQWYVTADDISAIGQTTWGSAGKVVVDVTSYQWSQLSFGPNGIVLGDARAALPFADIDAVGLFLSGQLGNVRIDNFEVSSLTPEPGALSAFAVALGVVHLRPSRRRYAANQAC